MQNVVALGIRATANHRIDAGNHNELRRGIPRYSNTINEPKPKWTRRKTYQRIRNDP
jgi:hypothetical protein